MDNITGIRICLTNLYKSILVRKLIYDVLSDDFEDNFDRIIKQAREMRSLLVKPAKLNKEAIKERAIEFGDEFETLEHLKKILDTIKVSDATDECDSNFTETSQDCF